MTETVNVHDAKSQLSKLLDRAHAGEEITIAKAGKPWARLMPLEASAPNRIPGRLRRWGPLSQPDLLLEPMAADELAAWQESALWPNGSQP